MDVNIVHPECWSEREATASRVISSARTDPELGPVRLPVGGGSGPGNVSLGAVITPTESDDSVNVEWIRNVIVRVGGEVVAIDGGIARRGIKIHLRSEIAEG